MVDLKDAKPKGEDESDSTSPQYLYKGRTVDVTGNFGGGEKTLVGTISARYTVEGSEESEEMGEEFEDPRHSERMPTKVEIKIIENKVETTVEFKRGDGEQWYRTGTRDEPFKIREICGGGIRLTHIKIMTMVKPRRVGYLLGQLVQSK